MFSTLTYITRSLEENMHLMFNQFWTDICLVQTSRYYMLKALSHIYSTLVTHTLLQINTVIAIMNGEYLSIWNCVPVYNYTF